MVPIRLTSESNGFSLLEVIVVVLIISTLVALGTLNFSQWQLKSQIEQLTRQFYTDVNSARLQAIFKKKPQGIVLNPTSYTFYQYSSENENTAGAINGTTGSKVSSLNFTHQMSNMDGSAVANQMVVFNIQGITTNTATIRVNPVGSGASYDCVVIGAARTSLGNMQNGSCILK